MSTFANALIFAPWPAFPPFVPKSNEPEYAAPLAFVTVLPAAPPPPPIDCPISAGDPAPPV